MNRFVLGTCLLVLSPFVAGCGKFYVLNPPDPLPTPTPVAPPPAFPIDATEGIQTTLPTPSRGIALNGADTPGLPTAFHAVDVRYIPRTPNDPANCTAFLVLQSVTKDASGNLIPGTTDANNPVRLAGIIVPGPSGQAAAGLQDPDLMALQNLAYQKSMETIRSWAQGQLGDVVSPSATPTVKPTPTVAPRRTGARTAPTLPPVTTSQNLRNLDIYQDPRYPVDSDSRRVVQAFFTTTREIKGAASANTASGAPTGGMSSGAGGGSRVLIPTGTPLSLNRMMIRAGWAVVDLYSSTAFDQQTWLLDEAYARQRRLGMWGLQLNGKRISLQQRVPVASTGTGALSQIPVTSNNPATSPGATPLPGGKPVTSATQVPNTLTPTLAPSSLFPRVIKSSGTHIQIGPKASSLLPPPSQNAAPAPAAPGAAGGVPGISGAVPGATSPGP